MRSYFVHASTPRLLPSVVLLALSCNRAPNGPLAPSDEVMGERVSLAATEVTVGLAGGTLRESRKLGRFEIAKHPTTHAQLRACRAAKACPDSEEPSDADPSALAKRTPLDVARAYCEWVGARIPTLAEWLLAARGPDVHRFSWGDGPPTCDKHPATVVDNGGLERADLNRAPETGAASNPLVPVRDDGPPKPLIPSVRQCSSSIEQLLVGRHPAGKAPSGAEDFLLTNGELLSKQPDSLFGACRGANGACLVRGLAPGAIDSVVALAPSNTPASFSDGAQSYGFRCIWSEGEP